jgi:hypothetical protein
MGGCQGAVYPAGRGGKVENSSGLGC